MGYLKRKISRARCAADVDAAFARQGAALVSRAAEAAPGRRGRRRSYLRFAVGRIEPASQHRLGIFRAAGALEQSDALSDDDRGRLRRALRWFNKNLKVPRVSSRAVFWFKSDATECLERVWLIVRLLDAHGLIVWMLRADQPGQVVYEDVHQVAALPEGARLRRCQPVSI